MLCSDNVAQMEDVILESVNNNGLDVNNWHVTTTELKHRLNSGRGGPHVVERSGDTRGCRHLGWCSKNWRAACG